MFYFPMFCPLLVLKPADLFECLPNVLRLTVGKLRSAARRFSHRGLLAYQFGLPKS